MHQDVVQEQNAVSQPPHSSTKLFLILGVIVLLVLTGAGAYVLGTQAVQPTPEPIVTAPVVQSTTIALPQPTVAPDLTADWKTYTIQAVGMSFKLPPQLQKFGTLSEVVKPNPSPNHGSTLCISISPSVPGCPSANFAIATTSIDYDVGRGLGFDDLQGFIKKDGKYYAIYEEKTIDIPNGVAEEVKNANGVSVLKIKGSIQEGPSALPGLGSFSALINSTNKTYPGFAVRAESSSIDEATFDQMLSTFKFE